MQRGLRALELSTEVNPGMARRLGRPRTVLDFGCSAGMNGSRTHAGYEIWDSAEGSKS